jgi:hypothetical protein
MKNYQFYLEGLEKYVWFEEESENLARAGVWNSLSNDEQDIVVSIDCVDVKEVDQ